MYPPILWLATFMTIPCQTIAVEDGNCTWTWHTVPYVDDIENHSKGIGNQWKSELAIPQQRRHATFFRPLSSSLMNPNGVSKPVIEEVTIGKQGATGIGIFCESYFPLTNSIYGSFELVPTGLFLTFLDPIYHPNSTGLPPVPFRADYGFLTTSSDKMLEPFSGVFLCNRRDHIWKLKMYLPGKEGFIRRGPNMSVVTSLTDAYILPCAVSHPNYTVTVYREGVRVDGREYEYDSIDGAHFYNLLDGNYTCATQVDGEVREINYVANKSLLGVPEALVILPYTSAVHQFVKKQLLFSCTSRNYSALPKLVLRTTISSTLFEFQITNGTDKMGRRFVQGVLESTAPTSGIVECALDGNNGGLRQSWEWKFQVFGNPIISIEQDNGNLMNISCIFLSPPVRRENSAVSLLLANCGTKDDCSHALECGLEHRKGMCDKGTLSEVLKYLATDPYVTVVSSLDQNNTEFTSYVVETDIRSGVFACLQFDAVYSTTFSETLEKVIALECENVRTTEVLRLLNVPDIWYVGPNITYDIMCEVATGMSLSSHLFFSLGLDNGKWLYLPHEYTYTEIDGGGHYFIKYLGAMLNIEGGAGWSLTISPPISTVAVGCNSFFWDHQASYSSQHFMITKYYEAPTITNGTKDVELVTGDSDRNYIFCNITDSKTTPYTIFKWTKDDVEVAVLDLKTKIASKALPDGGSLLLFSNVQKDAEGVYSCIAENVAGKDSFKFTANVVADPFNYTISLIVVLTCLTIFLLVLLGGLSVRMARMKKERRQLTDEEVNEFHNGDPHSDGAASSGLDAEILTELEDIDFGGSKVLGMGNFGIVLHARFKSLDLDVAVKMPKPTITTEDFKSMLDEVKTLVYVGNHPNVVYLVGVCTEELVDRKIYVCMENCINGSLKQFLQKAERHPEDDGIINITVGNVEMQMSAYHLTRWCWDIAKGMEHLSAKNVIHGDLAARNVLLNRDLVAKLSDFGLSKRLYNNTNYTRKSKSAQPWRWLAIEALKHSVFSTKSDVWSFGITMWEIFTLGDDPFPTECFGDDFVARILSGMRLTRPKGNICTEEIWTLVNSTWKEEPNDRPTFFGLAGEIKCLLEAISSLERDNDYSSLFGEYVLAPCYSGNGADLAVACSVESEISFDSQEIDKYDQVLLIS